MNVELTPEATRWIENEVAQGVFPSVQEAVRQVVDLLRLDELRAKLDSAVAEGGRNTSEDALRFVRDHLECRDPPPDRGRCRASSVSTAHCATSPR